MSAQRTFSAFPTCLLGLLFSAGTVPAQQAASALPPTAPTQPASLGITAPLAATPNAGGAERVGASSHAAEVTCSNGQLEVHAHNSGLNQILRAISRCTGMRVTGRVAEQRVFGDYGPAAPATVLATLLDGTGSNMLLRETASDQPAELILTPRTGGPTPPPPVAANTDAEDTEEADDQPGSQRSLAMPPNPYRPAGQGGSMRSGSPSANGQPGFQPGPNSAVTGPQPIPQPINNVNGSPNNRSPTASTYPTTNSVPLDAIATPSTTPPANGIVDAPNPPPAGSDTAAALNGAPNGTPGTTNISPDETSLTSTPGGTNTTVPANTGGQTSPNQAPTEMTPEQIFQELQRRQQQQQQQQQQDTNPQ